MTNVISRIFGFFAAVRFPAKVQAFINETYVKLFKIDMGEFKEVAYYESLGALFTRDLVKKREFVKTQNTLISPCDALITELGTIQKGGLEALQIKGFSYSINSLLGDFTMRKDKAKLKNGLFVNFYLSPSDYHHYHAPCDMRVLKSTHIPGALYPVNLKWLYKKAELFCENERVVLECETALKSRFWLVFVGALNVGKIRFLFDENIATNAKKYEQSYVSYKDLNLFQGEEMGFFEMGSTIVFLGEKDAFRALVKNGEKVKFTQEIITEQENKS
ncbi:MAG: phosphatidylserine decarboxylase [Campylobacteraceae bacterium]|jgi:phosphatidylserine decarboxylase|nr:phosphatidylserine decarboxylase [Campylobacteraceae bacterium]